jgi:uncharacterized membrane protein YfcA
VVTFTTVLAAHQHGSVAQDWPTGIALGAGGLVGGYVGARLHARMPEKLGPIAAALADQEPATTGTHAGTVAA